MNDYSIVLATTIIIPLLHFDLLASLSSILGSGTCFYSGLYSMLPWQPLFEPSSESGCHGNGQLKHCAITSIFCLRGALTIT